MTPNDSRQKSRRQSERRSKERRKITYPFGSVEWLNAIKHDYFLWPKQDRRHQDRRSLDRRQSARRVKNANRSTSTEHTKKLYSLLTNEEKQMLNEIIQSDVTD